MGILPRRLPGVPPFLMRGLAELYAGLTNALRPFERRCPVCHDVFSDNAPGPTASACPACRNAMPRRVAGYCPRCGEIMADAQAPCAPCGRCLTEAPLWTEFRFYGVFEGTLRETLHRAKFSADSACLSLLAAMLDEICRDLPEPDAIVPMPLHPARLRARGFNQCREIARRLARRRKLPIRDELLRRTRNTAPQTTLSRKARLTNLEHVFTASPSANGLRLLLVDDTATTGASLRKGAEALLLAGAARVDVAVIARASRHDTWGN